MTIAQETKPSRSRRRIRGKGTAIAVTVIVAMLLGTGIAAASGLGFKIKGGGPGNAMLRCGGGMSQLGHVFDESNSVFPGDPATSITVLVFPGFQIEEVFTASHTGTHLDAPIHFGYTRALVDLDATEFVWPAYVIDVRQRMDEDGPDFQLTQNDIEDYEDEYGKIQDDSLVIIRTGFDQFFGTPAYEDNVPGFSGEAVQWLFDERDIAGLGSDTFGPDATIDGDFSATDTALANDGVTLPGMNNLESLNVRGDLIIAPAVRLGNGSGFQVNPLACHGR